MKEEKTTKISPQAISATIKKAAVRENSLYSQEEMYELLDISREQRERLNQLLGVYPAQYHEMIIGVIHSATVHGSVDRHLERLELHDVAETKLAKECFDSNADLTLKFLEKLLRTMEAQQQN